MDARAKLAQRAGMMAQLEDVSAAMAAVKEIDRLRAVNAELMAAARGLLVACRVLVDGLDESWAQSAEGTAGIAAARAAIAKASEVTP